MTSEERKKVKLPEGVSRRNIEQLLKELAPDWREVGNPLWDEFRRLDDEYEAALEEFKNSTPMKKLQARIEAAKDAHRKDRDARVIKVRAVRQEYYAKGPTAAVLRKLEALVEELNR